MKQSDQQRADDREHKISKLTFGSLFAGIGGIDLGLERAGMECKWQVEIDEHCRQVLTKHWPSVERHSDIRGCGRHNLRQVDLICGGFPCQDVAIVGRQVGITGERSGLWEHFHRLICELRPRYVLVENSTGLLIRGMDRVLRDLARIRYDAEWRVLSACSFGLPHARKRLFILAYPNGNRSVSPETWKALPLKTISTRGHQFARASILAEIQHEAKRLCVPTDHGIPFELDAIKGYGNAVVPQIAEWIGRRILEVDGSTKAN